MIAEIWLLFMTGFLGSMHCIGMCGGIVSALSLKSSQNAFRSNLLFNTGRVISYTTIGGIVGMTGGLIGNIGHFQAIRGTINILVGFVMILLSMELLGWFHILRSGSTITRFFSKLKVSKGGHFTIGAFMGIVPCGLTYAVYVKSLAAGSFYAGAAMSLAFALGTVPAILGIGTLTGTWTGESRKLFTYMAAGIVVMLACSSISSGARNLFAASHNGPMACCESKKIVKSEFRERSSMSCCKPKTLELKLAL